MTRSRNVIRFASVLFPVRWHSIAAQAADVGGDGRGHGGGLLIGSPLDRLNHGRFRKRGGIEPKLRDISPTLILLRYQHTPSRISPFPNPAPTRHNCDTMRILPTAQAVACPHPLLRKSQSRSSHRRCHALTEDAHAICPPSQSAELPQTTGLPVRVIFQVQLHVWGLFAGKGWALFLSVHLLPLLPLYSTMKH